MKPTEPTVIIPSSPAAERPMAGHFNVYRPEEAAPAALALSGDRRDFYKIWFVTAGEGTVYFDNQPFRIKAPALVFLNPSIPVSLDSFSGPHSGYFCLFTETFYDSQPDVDRLPGSVLFRPGGSPVYFPLPQSALLLSSVFDYMIREMRSVYPHKYELLRSYVGIVMHEALKSQPSRDDLVASQASRRICNMFMELLERQFPLYRPTDTVPFRSAQDFARALNIHPNHLNKSLKEITGKTTTDWIAERLSREAKALLRHSDWDVSGIAFALGFEHPSNFTLFFKKAIGESPKSYRQRHQETRIGV